MNELTSYSLILTDFTGDGITEDEAKEYLIRNLQLYLKDNPFIGDPAVLKELINKVKFINKAHGYELKKCSTLDDGTRIPSVDQGEIQGDSEVQQRNDRQGSGDSDVTERPGCDGEVLRIKVPDGFGKDFDITQ
jgi:hypothetical protein